MAALKPEIVITQAMGEIEMKFQRIRKCDPEQNVDAAIGISVVCILHVRIRQFQGLSTAIWDFLLPVTSQSTADSSVVLRDWKKMNVASEISLRYCV